MENGPDPSQNAMEHLLFSTIEEMLDFDTLGDLIGERVTALSVRPLLTEYNKSGSYLELVETNHGQGPKLVLKYVSMSANWLMRATVDDCCRSVTLWSHGLLDQMPPEIDHATIACARDGGDWVLLLRDVSDEMLAYSRFSLEDNEFMLDAMAALHATFFESPFLMKQDLGLCSLCSLYSMFSPRTGQRERSGQDEVPKRIVEGWKLMKRSVPAEVVDVIESLLDSPEPLCAALNRYPQTLIHGDWRHANQGLKREGRPRLVLLDWQLAAIAPPAVDLGRGLATNSPLFPVTKEEAISIYKVSLVRRLGARFSENWWEPQLALGMLGSFLQDGWAIVLKANHWRVGKNHREHWRADLDWWSEWVRIGAKWL